MKEASIHALRPDVDTLYAFAQEVVAGRLGGTEVYASPAVPGPRPGASRLLHEVESVEASIGSHVRVIGGYERNTVASSVERATGTKNERVHRVYEIWFKSLEGTSDPGMRRAEAHLRVRWERDAEDPMYRSARVGIRPSVGIPGSEDEDLIPRPPQLLDSVPQARHHAVGGR